MNRQRGLCGWTYAAPDAEVPAGSGEFDCVVAIPARDESVLIERCLRALAAQEGAPPFAVVLFLNNCRDATARTVKALAPELPFALFVHESDLGPGFADAAWARRLAFNAAAPLVRPGGAIMSTDADSFAGPDWLRSCLDALAEGADVVCGFVAPDFSDAPSLDFDTMRIAALEFEYSQLACQLQCTIDPVPGNPWPRHQVETGANLTVRVEALRAIGGIPHICPGEDQAFVRLAQQAGFVVRHDFRPHVTTSSRLDGRAPGGWSEDLRTRFDADREFCHERLEPARTLYRRAKLRAGLRALYPGPEFRARAARFAPDAAALKRVLDAPHFDAAWAILMATSPLLAPQRVRPRALDADFRLLGDYLDRVTGSSAQAPSTTHQVSVAAVS